MFNFKKTDVLGAYLSQKEEASRSSSRQSEQTASQCRRNGQSDRISRSRIKSVRRTQSRKSSFGANQQTNVRWRRWTTYGRYKRSDW